MIQSEKLKEHARRLRLYNIANRMDSILHHAQEEKPTYPEFLSLVLGTEVEMKERKDYERRLVAARLRYTHSSCHSYVVMSIGGKILVVNGENDPATKEIYHNISEKK